MRALSPVEVAMAFAVGGSLLAVTVPSFLRNLHASRMSEPIEALERLSARALMLADAAAPRAAFPETCPLTPASVPRSSVVDPPGTWNHPTWRLLAFSFDTPHAYAFQFNAQNGAEASHFSVEAHGDLDGDGVVSTFRVAGESRQGRPPSRGPLEVIREVE